MNLTVIIYWILWTNMKLFTGLSEFCKLPTGCSNSAFCHASHETEIWSPHNFALRTFFWVSLGVIVFFLYYLASNDRHRSGVRRFRWLHCWALAQALWWSRWREKLWMLCFSGDAGVHRERRARAVDHEIVRIRLGFRGSRIWRHGD